MKLYSGVLGPLLFLLSVVCRADDQPSGYGQKLVATQPNMIFIMADDLGYGDVGCFGQKVIETPRLDQMAQEGMKFTQFYAGNTVCAPSRSVLLTGQHMGHTQARLTVVFLAPVLPAFRNGE